MTKYEPLFKFLLDRRSESLTIAFQEIELIIQEKLPISAYESTSWWNNRQPYSVQARAWIEAGWKVDYVNLDLKTVKFRRTESGHAP